MESYSIYADKFEVRKYIQETIGTKYLNELYGVYDTVDQIDPKKLPKSFVLKATHGSGWNIICPDKNILDWEKTKNILNQWLNQSYYHVFYEKQYKNIRPRIICEKLLKNHDGQLTDYKIFCFSGRPHFIEVDKDRFTKHTRNIYDVNWHKESFSIEYPNNDRSDPKPKNFSAMIQLATVLSAPFKHVRVDFFNIGGKIIFSELTFTHGNGLARIRPRKYDYFMGSLLSLKKP